MHALIVDDREHDLDLTARALQSLYPDDLEITQASRLSYARQLLREQTYDLVILDLNFPDSLSDETWYSIRPLVRESSVIVQSAYLDRQLMLHLIYAGVHHFIDKCNPAMTTSEAAMEAIQREVLKLMAIRTQRAVEPTRAELMDRLVEVERAVDKMRHVLYEGNGDSVLTQMRLMAIGIGELNKDIAEIKPQVNAMAQARVGRLAVIITTAGAILAALVGPWAAARWGGP